MENKIRELSNANRRKRLLKRVVAFLSIVVLLFTVNSLKLTAITLSRVPACGLKKHIHKAKCYDGNGNLICGKVEHQHTDACYQVAPNDLTLEIEGDGVAVDEPSLDLSLSLDDGVLQVDDSALQLDDSLLELDNPPVNDAGSGGQTNTSQKPTYELGEKAKLSKIIKKTKLGVSIDEVNEVGVVDYDGTQASLLSIEQIDGDYIIAAARDFDEVDLAIVAEKGIEVVRLVGGRMPAEVVEQTDPQTSSEVAEETPSEEAEQNPSEAAEQGDVQAPADAAEQGDVQTDVQATEETDPQIDVQTDLQAGAESTEDEISSDIVVDDQVAVDEFNGGESDALALDLDDAVVVQQQGEEAPVEEQGKEAPAEDQGGIIVTEAEVPADEQGEETPAEEQVGEVETQADVQGEEPPADAQYDETPAEEQAGDVEAPADTQADEEKQSIQQSDIDEVAVEAQDGGIEVEAPADIQGVEAPVDVQGVEAPVEEQGGVEAPVDVQGDDDEALAEEQGVEALADVQGVETPADVQGDDDKALAEEQGVEAPADTQSDEEDQSVQQSDQVEALVEEQIDEQADEVEQSVQQSDMDEVAADTQVEEEEQADQEETLTDVADEAPAEEEDQADEEEQAAEEENASEEDVEAEEEQPTEEENASEVDEEAVDEEEQPAEEEQADESAEEEQADEAAEEEQGDEAAEEEQADEAPAAAIYSATIDLSEVETYPISLMEMMAKATLSDAVEDQPEAIDDAAAADEEAEATVETAEEAAAEEEVEAAPEASAWTIEYDTSLFSIEAVEDDYLITPIQSFERTQIIVTNDSRYELTLVNCVLADESKDETVEQEAASVYAATIDLTDVEAYPLSLNEMMSAARAEQPDEEQAQEQAQDAQPDETEEQTQDEQLALNIEYDENLLSIEIVGDDHLITPLQSFERTVITVESDGRYELTLVNCALTEDEAEAESNDGAFPAQDFEGQTDYIRVVVSAPAGAFPAGTTMKVVDVADEKTLTDIEDTVSEEFVEVRSVHAVDITFTDVDGNEIEPLVPISVVMSLVESEQIQKAETVVVHVDDEGATQVVESESAGEAVVSIQTGDGAQLPDGEGEAIEEDAAASQDAVTPQPTGEGEAFQADSFSIYAMVQTEAIEARYIAADGTTWNISVGYGKEAEIPAGASLAVSEVVGEDAEAYLAQTAEALRGKETITLARFFDITILDSEGREVQPKATVEVKAVLADGTQDTVKAVHFAEEGPEIIEASQDDEAVVFEAEGFSVYGIVYTVDFHYGVDGQTYEFTLPGGGAVGMRELAPALGLVEDGEDAIDLFVESIEGIAFSDEELVKPVPVEMNMTVGALKQRFDLESDYSAELTEAQIAELNDKVLQAPDWALVSLKPFDTEETLTITMKNGEVITVAVTDAQLNREVITASGETYVITVTYGEDALIPDGAELKVREILPVDDEYAGYLAKAQRAVSGEASADEAGEDMDAGEEAAEANGEGEYARFFDIEIWANDQKVEPAAAVTVDIALADAPVTEEELKVVHFDEADGPVVMQTEAGKTVEDEAVGTTNLRFETDSFSTYGVITYPNQPQIGVNDLGGKSFYISRAFKNEYYYLTSTVDEQANNGKQNNSSPESIRHTTDRSQAGVWYFESTDTAGQYYIYSMQSGEKKYLNMSVEDEVNYYSPYGSTAHINLVKYEDSQLNNRQKYTVTRNNGNYYISTTLNGHTYYINHWNNACYAGFYNPSTEDEGPVRLHLDNTYPSLENAAYFVVLKKDGNYYAVLNDGRLEPVTVDGNGKFRIEKEPIMWKVQDDGTGCYISHESFARTINETQKYAVSWYYSYLNPNTETGFSDPKVISPFDPGKATNIDAEREAFNNKLRDEIDPYNAQIKQNSRVYLEPDQNNTYRIRSADNSSYYIGVSSAGDHVTGCASLADSAEVLFAKLDVFEPVQGWGSDWARKNLVNHIDIGIDATAQLHIPLAPQKYYDAAGNVVKNLDRPEMLRVDQHVPITEQDIKNAKLTAFKYVNEETKEKEILNDVYYITGYSGNAATEISAVQVRIEGQFKVSTVEDYTNNNTFDGDEDYRRRRLKNRVWYNIVVQKEVEFDLELEDGTQLYNAAGKPLKSTAMVELSASFNYWSLDNECPGLRDGLVASGNYFTGETVNEWWNNNQPVNYLGWLGDNGQPQGVIPHQAGGVSGMDFILSGQSGRNAVVITKMIEDQNGRTIPLGKDETCEVEIWQRDIQDSNNPKAQTDLVKDRYLSKEEGGINLFEGDRRPYEQQGSYMILPSKKNITVGEAGYSTVYDYDVPNGMVGVKENAYPKQITDKNGKVWNYDHTYIRTDYVKRNSNDGTDKYHTTKDYPDAEDWKVSVPEVLGPYKMDNNTDENSDFLEFYIHNVYVPESTSVEVEKKWKQGNADFTPPTSAKVTATLGRYRLVDKDNFNQQTDKFVTAQVNVYQVDYNIDDPNSHWYSNVTDFNAGDHLTVTLGYLYNAEVSYAINGEADTYCQLPKYDDNAEPEEAKAQNHYLYHTFQVTVPEDGVVRILIHDPWSCVARHITVVSDHAGRNGVQASGSAATVTGVPVPPPPADKPDMVYQDDAGWNTEGTFKIQLPQADQWKGSIDNLDVYDGEGNEYLYYIRNVTESGVPDGTQWIIVKDPNGSYMTSTGDEGDALRIANLVPASVKIIKQDSASSQSLKGAKFRLQKLEKGTWATIREQIDMSDTSDTDVNGLFDGRYRLEETESPSGHKVLDKMVYFNMVNGQAILTDENGDASKAAYDNLIVLDGKQLTVKNEPVGALDLVKTVPSEAASFATNETFTFELTLTRGSEAYTGPLKLQGGKAQKKNESNVWTQACDATTEIKCVRPDSDGKLRVQVTGASMAHITEIPAGVTYVVAEVDIPTDWMQVDTPVYSDRVSDASATPTITMGETDSVTVTNTKLGALKITKVVTVNNAVDTSDLTDGTYTFSVVGSDSATSNEHHTVSITFENGRAIKWKVDNGEEQTVAGTDNQWSVVVPDLIPGAYTITETSSGNMTLKSVTGGTGNGNTADGTISAIVIAGDTTPTNAAAQVVYTNNRDVVDIDATKTWKDDKGERINHIVNDASVTFELQKKVGDVWSKVELEGLTNSQTLAVTNAANADAWKAEWHALPKYDGSTLIQYRVVETDATFMGVNVKPDTDPVADITIEANTRSKTVNIDNTLPTTDISVTKQWKDGTEANEDRVFSQSKDIFFTLYQKLGTAEGQPYKEDNVAIVGRVTYTPAANGNPASWSTWTRSNLPRFVYDETSQAWTAASYYVVEDVLNGVKVTYQKGNDTAVEKAENAMVTEADDHRTVTIINEDIPVGLNILKVDANDMTKPLAGAQFELCCVDETNASIQTETKIQAELTGSDGKTAFTGLVSGYYMVEETVVPEGYILTSSRRFYIKVDIGATTDQIQLVDWDNAQKEWVNRSTDPKLTFEAETSTVKVGNEPGASLPATGGPGTTLYYAAGAALLLLAVSTLIFRKKADDE